jgi:hypothetical protein
MAAIAPTETMDPWPARCELAGSAVLAGALFSFIPYAVEAAVANPRTPIPTSHSGLDRFRYFSLGFSLLFAVAVVVGVILLVIDDISSGGPPHERTRLGRSGLGLGVGLGALAAVVSLFNLVESVRRPDLLYGAVAAQGNRVGIAFTYLAPACLGGVAAWLAWRALCDSTRDTMTRARVSQDA